MSTYLPGGGVQDAASGQCLLPEDALPWLFCRAHTCMLSPLSVCSLTFGPVKIEDTVGGEDAGRLEEPDQCFRVTVKDGNGYVEVNT